jgi:hypothetical protein
MLEALFANANQQRHNLNKESLIVCTRQNIISVGLLSWPDLGLLLGNNLLKLVKHVLNKKHLARLFFASKND